MLSRHTLQVGEWVKVSCQATDHAGAVLPKVTFSLEIVPKTGFVRRGLRFKATRPGTWDIRCVGRMGIQLRRDLTPASVQVIALPIDKVRIWSAPQKRWFRSFALIRLRWDARDKLGHTRSSLQPRVSVSPREGADLSLFPVIRFRREGRYQVHLRFPRTHMHKTYIEKSLTFQVEGRGPTITLNTPRIGARLSGAPTVQVRGRIRDSYSGVASARLNGKMLRLRTDGSFYTTVVANWGLNTIRIVAHDKAGRHTRFHRSFLFAKRYIRPKRIGMFWQWPDMRRAIVTRLHRNFLDDGQRQELNNVASIVSYILNHTDIDALSPKRLANGRYKLPPFGPTWKYRIEKAGAFQLGKRYIAFSLSYGRLDFRFQLRNVKIPLRLHYGKRTQLPLLLAKSLLCELRFRIDVKNQKIRLTLEKSTFNFDLLKTRGLTGLFWVLKPILDRVLRSRLRGALEKLVKQRLLPFLQELISQRRLEEHLYLSPEQGGLALRIRSRLDGVQIDTSGLSVALQGGVDIQPVPASIRRSARGLSSGRRRFQALLEVWRRGDGQKVVRTEKQGTPRGALALPDKGQEWGPEPLCAAFDLNFLNQLLYRLWAHGAFTRDLTPLLQRQMKLPKLPFVMALPGLRFRLTLPPMLTPGSRAFPVVLTLGGLHIKLRIPIGRGRTQEILIKLSMRFGFQLRGSAQDLRVVLSPRPLQRDIEIVGLDAFGESAALSAALESTIDLWMPRLARSMLERLPLRIPRLPKLPFQSWRRLAKIQMQPAPVRIDGHSLLLCVGLREKKK